MHIVDHGMRTGRFVARAAARRRCEHSVAVIDQDPQAFRRLGDDFAGRRSRASDSTATPSSRPASSRPTRSPRSAAATTRTSSPPGSPARPSASSGSSRASTTPSGPRSTSGSASPPSRPCRGRPAGCSRACSARRPPRPGATRPARSRCCDVTPDEGWVGRTGGRVRGRDRLAGRRCSPGSAPASCPQPDTLIQSGDSLHVLTAEDARRRASRSVASQPPEGATR